MTPFSHLPGQILPGLEKARYFVRECCVGPVSVLIAVPQERGLPAYTVGRTFWHEGFEEALSLR